ncbi:MAG: Gfo/Idh/MocA family oxidoreductase [Clostridia bacterium]|nr:Gfo/Idh/MocA family oxidoreductase [Clostridia bacterium]
MKLLFYGFRHGHINGLYKLACGSDNIEIAGCIEPDNDARAKAERELGCRFSDLPYDSWLDSDIDTVAIGCAYGDRGEAIIRALRAGKHIIADKPICTSLQQLETISALCREKNLKIACMLDLRYLPQTLAAYDLLTSGRLGQVRNIAFNGQHCIDYPNRPKWYFEPGKHGGTINDLAIHGVDLVRMLTGSEFAHIDAARVWNGYAAYHPDFRDCATFMARLDNGAGVLADVSYSAPSYAFTLPSYWEFRVWCERGMLSFNYKDEHVTMYEEGNPSPQKLTYSGTIAGYMDELATEIKNNTCTVTENVLKSTQTALMIQQQADREWQK